MASDMAAQRRQWRDGHPGCQWYNGSDDKKGEMDAGADWCDDNGNDDKMMRMTSASCSSSLMLPLLPRLDNNVL